MSDPTPTSKPAAQPAGGDVTLPGTPGTGPEPEPEPEGFREEQITAEEERQRQEREETTDRSAKAKEFYSGGAADDDAENPLKR